MSINVCGTYIDNINEYKIIDPYWSKQVWLDMIYGYIGFIEAEETERLGKLCTAGIASQEEITAQ